MGGSRARIMGAAGGLLLVVVAAVLSAARAIGTAPAAVLLGLGVAAVLLAAAPAARTLLAASRGRAARRGADALLATLLFTAILVVVQATSLRRSHQFDLTRNQRHTLAPQTIELLATLDRDVEAIAFFRQGSAANDGARELLQHYARRSPRFRYRMLDPDRHPDAVARYGASPDEIVVVAGERQRTAWPAGEQALTNALLQVTRESPPVVCVVTGHGEHDIGSTGREGYSAARLALEAQGYGVRPLSLVATGQVPDDAAVVVIAGPRQDYLEPEIDALRVFQRRGGSLLFMIDPRVELPRLEDLLADRRLEVLDAVVLEDRELRAGDRTFDATVARVRRYERHAITRGFNYLTMYPRARPVYIREDSAAVGVAARYLAITGENTWGEVDMDAFSRGVGTREGDDLAGPLPLSAVSELIPPGGPRSRAVLIGDSDFANNVFFGLLGNADLFQNMIAWLAEDEARISIRPRDAAGEPVYLSERQGRLVFAVCIVLMPLSSVVAGALVFLRRRSL